MRWASKSPQTLLRRRKDRSDHRLMLRASGSHRLSTLECTYIAIWLMFVLPLRPAACRPHTIGVAMAASCAEHVPTCTLLRYTMLKYPALEPCLQSMLLPHPHSPMFIICPPSQKHIPVRLLRAQPPADARQTRNDRAKTRRRALLHRAFCFAFKKTWPWSHDAIPALSACTACRHCSLRYDISSAGIRRLLEIANPRLTSCFSKS